MTTDKATADLFHGFAYPVVVFRDDIVRAANERFLETFSYSLQEVIDQPLKSFFLPESQFTLQQAQTSSFQGLLQVVGLAKDGEKKYLEAYLKPDIPSEQESFVLSLRELEPSEREEGLIRESQIRHQIFKEVARSLSACNRVVDFVNTTVSVLAQFFPDIRVAYSTIDDRGKLCVLCSREPNGMPCLEGVCTDLSRAPKYLEALRSGELLVISDVREDSRLSPLADEMQVEGTVAVLDAPLLHSEILLGLLCFDASKRTHWTSHHISTLREVAEYMAVAISELYTKEEFRFTEHALRESESRFNQMADNIDQIFWMTDAEKTNVIYVSPAYEKIWGQSCESLYREPKSFLRSLHPEDRDYVAENLLSQKSGNYVEEYRVIHPDGSVRWVEDRAYPVLDERGEVYRIVGIASDITSRKDAEQEKLELEKCFCQAQKMESLGVLASGIAHDFNNLLGSVIGYAELILRRSEEGSRTHKDVQELLKTGVRGKKLVEQILAFGRKGEWVMAPLDLANLVEEAEQFLSRSLMRNIQLRTEIDVSSSIVFGDSTQLYQVLMNLATNAAHAMEQNGGELVFSLRDVKSRSELPAALRINTKEIYLRLSVSDTGPGVSPEILDKIFDPFFTTKPVGKGTGMGLAAVHGIIDRHQGSMVVRNNQSGGALFEMYFPVSDQPLPTSEQEIGETLAGTGRILFVDDEESLVSVSTQYLEELGYEVVGVTNGEEALRRFRHNPSHYDIVVSDQAMPGMYGEVLVRELLKVDSDIPIILCSGYGHIYDLDEAKSLGIRLCLAKPIALSALTKVIRDNMRTRPAEQVSEKAQIEEKQIEKKQIEKKQRKKTGTQKSKPKQTVDLDKLSHTA